MGMGSEARGALWQQRYVISTTLHLLVWTVAAAASLRLAIGPGDGSAWAPEAFGLFLGAAFAVKGVAALLDGSFRDLWRHTGVEDLGSLMGSSLGAALVLSLFVVLAAPLGVPRTTPLYDAGITFAMLGFLRLSPRLAREVAVTWRERRGPGVVLVGRLETLDVELRRLRAQRHAPVRPIGLVVEEDTFDGARLRRVKVLDLTHFEALVRSGAVAEVRLVPPIREALLAKVTDLCRAARVRCRPSASPEALREMMDRDSGHLLERAAVQLDEESIARVVGDRSVLVTGAGGSIGSELARQILRYGPRVLTLVDRSENALFQIESNLLSLGLARGCRIEGRILDVRDATAVNRLFAQQKPNVVFHAAAHKHVPMMERHVAEAVLNNVIGTRTVVDAAHRFGVENFVFVSTDKAVNPTSVMGATKRIGELYIQAMAHRSRTRFVAVRFGNVLGSNGSVVPIFIEQIRRGGPVTVTHPDMQRFFMSIPEACQLVLQAAALGHGGEVFILDMGAAVKIVDLARRLIKQAGLRPGRDISIVYSGTRPGEKLNEELMLSTEDASKTAHPSIWVGRIAEIPWPVLTRSLDEIEPLAMRLDDAGVARMLIELVPEYRPGTPARQEPAIVLSAAHALPVGAVEEALSMVAAGPSTRLDAKTDSNAAEPAAAAVAEAQGG